MNAKTSIPTPAMTNTTSNHKKSKPEFQIVGIQQIGIGNPDTPATFAWYRKHLGIDIQVFDEAAEAGLMLPYTGGEKRSRHAILAISIQGGGGLEIWQYTSRVPQAPAFQPEPGDLGIFIAKYKCKDITGTYSLLHSKDINFIGKPVPGPDGKEVLYFKDPHGNIGQLVNSPDWFTTTKWKTGGVYGATIGVSDMENSLAFYRNVLGYDTILYDETGSFADFELIPGGSGRFRRVLITHSEQRKGPFSKLLGTSQLELVQALDKTPRKIFENRFWGDLGYIHLCFDVVNMKALQRHCESRGHVFTVDSAKSFDMGEAAGHFAYIEDPDGTLIEFVETHKVPVVKKLNWYIDLNKRPKDKALPDWMLRALAFNRVKDSKEKGTSKKKE